MVTPIIILAGVVKCLFGFLIFKLLNLIAIEVIKSEPKSQGRGRFKYINITAPMIEINIAKSIENILRKMVTYLIDFWKYTVFFLKRLPKQHNCYDEK